MRLARRFRCLACYRTFTDRSATPFTRLHWPREVVVTAVRWCFVFRLSLSPAHWSGSANRPGRGPTPANQLCPRFGQPTSMARSRRTRRRKPASTKPGAYISFAIYLRAVADWQLILHAACERELLELKETNDDLLTKVIHDLRLPRELVSTSVGGTSQEADSRRVRAENEARLKHQPHPVRGA